MFAEHERRWSRVAALEPPPGEPVDPHPTAPTPRSGTGASAGDVARAALASSLALLEQHEPGLATGAEALHVHQARVATRRFRSDLRTFRPLLAREWADDLRDELRWLGRLLGEVRDADVLGDRLRRRVDALAPADRFAAQPLLDELSTRRERAAADLAAAHDSHRYEDLLTRLVVAARTPPLTTRAASSAESVVPDLARRPWRRLRRTVRSLGDDPADEALHETRIAVKRCRYAVAAVAPVVGARAHAFAGALGRLQNRLGEHQDAVVAAAWLRALAPRLDPATAFVTGELAEIEHREARRARKRWQPAWSRVRKARLR